MTYRASIVQLAKYRGQIEAIRGKMRKVQREIEPELVADYEFDSSSGRVRLSQLFGAHGDLYVIHNMGSSCSHCTLWADGYNGIYPHLSDRAAFVVSSPDAPADQRAFAAARGWRFPMVSHRDTTFAADMGYRSKAGRWLPGISVFQLRKRRVVRVSDSSSRPLDDFCALWHLLELLPEGAGTWRPRLAYETRAGGATCCDSESKRSPQ